MAFTVRVTEEQEKQLDELMALTGQATKAGFVLYMIENGKEIMKNDSKFRQIKALEEEIKLKEKEISRIEKMILREMQWQGLRLGCCCCTMHKNE